MSTRKRQVFSAEFKREAVALLGKGDKEVAQLARELGVKRSHLYREVLAAIEEFVDGLR